MDKGLEETDILRRLEARVTDNPDAARRWQVLPSSHRAAWVNWISEAKDPGSARSRLDQTVARLADEANSKF